MDKYIHSESMFIDSGAHTLYNWEVLQTNKPNRKTKVSHTQAEDMSSWRFDVCFVYDELAEKRSVPKFIIGGKGRREVAWTQGDFSYYDLRRGTPFWKYCHRYGKFMQAMKGRNVICANVDAISDPERTWLIQQHFENEYGVRPVPIVHYQTPMSYVDRYIKGHYPLIGLGGLGQGVSRHQYFTWADQFFTHICPKENNYLPIVRTHGFAMTSWELMSRYPWWSVDSATWVKLSAYGWLYIPRWKKRIGFRFDRPPMMFNFSFRSPQRGNPEKHFENLRPSAKADVQRWLDHIGAKYGSVDKDGKMKEFGVTSHHRARSIANLIYLKELEAYLPQWPSPLSRNIIEQNKYTQDSTFKYDYVSRTKIQD